jgi:hypothetical protein
MAPDLPATTDAALAHVPRTHDAILVPDRDQEEILIYDQDGDDEAWIQGEPLDPTELGGKWW